MKIRALSIGVLALIAFITCGTVVAQPVCAQGLVFSDSASTDSQATGDKRIAIAQRLLHKLGLFQDAADGAMTPATRTAIANFAQANGLPPSDKVTDDLLARLRRAAWTAAAAQYKAMQSDYLDPDGIREAQTLLKSLGYNPGGIDSAFGPGTMSAIETFQDDQQITIDGLPTRAVLMNLKRLQASKQIQFAGTLRVLNWTDYIDPAVLERFEAETRIQVIYDTYGSNEEMIEKLKSATVPFDVVVPSSEQVLRLADQNLIQPIDKTKLPNLQNIDPKILTYIDTLDPENKHQVPYMWGTIGIGANKAALAKAGAHGEVDSLRYIFDPTYARKLSGCGVRVLDSASDAIPLVMIYLGLNPASRNLDDIRKTEPVLQAIKEWVRPISTADYIDAVANGKICVALAFSGDMVQARDEANNHADVAYQIPIEGSTLWFDTMAIPANARNVAGAHQFLDFLMRPKESAAISNFVSYANANQKSAPFINPDLLKDQGVFPTPAAMQRLQVLPHLTPEVQAEYERIWKEFKD